MRTVWNDFEDEALDYLPHIDQIIYLRGIRRRMDYATGIAGNKLRISRAWLMQLVEVHPASRSSIKEPEKITLEKLRSSLRRLEKAGLIIWIKTEDRGLVFQCPLADQDSFVQNESNPRATLEQPLNNPRTTSDFDDNQLKSVNISEAAPTPVSRPKKPKVPERNPIPGTGNREKEEVFTHLSDSEASSAKRRPVVVETADSQSLAVHKPDAVTEVFTHWQATMDKPSTKLDSKRKKAIAGRLKDGYTVSDLKAAIEGCKASEWHMGKNDRNRPFNDIELICRDSSRVDSFRDRVKATVTNNQELDDWINSNVIDSRTFDAEFYTVTDSAQCAEAF